MLTKKLLIPMTVENTHAYIESMIQNGPSDDLHAQINVKFKSEHIHQALKERGTSKDELLKKAAGGASTDGWTPDPSNVVSAATCAA